MQKRNPRDTLRQLNKAADRQNQQFVASLLVTVAVLMKKQGLTQLDVTPEDLATLVPGESLLPAISPSGGIAFSFVTDEVSSMAKLPVPAEMQPAPEWRSGASLKAEDNGWYTARGKNSKRTYPVYYDGFRWFKNDNLIVCPFSVSPIKAPKS